MSDNIEEPNLSRPLTAEDYEWSGVDNSHRGGSLISDIGFYGNVFVRSHHLKKAGDTNGGGHYHLFDHVTLIVKGSVKVEVEGYAPTRYSAPKFVIINKDKEHLFTALEDDTMYYCVFALRDIDGEVTDVYSEANSPYYWSFETLEHRKVYELQVESYKLKKQKLEEQTLLKEKK